MSWTDVSIHTHALTHAHTQTHKHTHTHTHTHTQTNTYLPYTNTHIYLPHLEGGTNITTQTNMYSGTDKYAQIHTYTVLIFRRIITRSVTFVVCVTSSYMCHIIICIYRPHLQTYHHTQCHICRPQHCPTARAATSSPPRRIVP